MPDPKPARAPLPPRWFIRLAWIAHRRLHEWTGGRLGLWRPKPGGWGAMRITTIGRRTGRARPVILGYFAQGDERERLWARWRQIDKNFDACAARRSMPTAVVVLEPRRQSQEEARDPARPQG